MGQTWPLLHLCSSLFFGALHKIINQQDSNSHHRSRRWGHWPLSIHRVLVKLRIQFPTLWKNDLGTEISPIFRDGSSLNFSSPSWTRAIKIEPGQSRALAIDSSSLLWAQFNWLKPVFPLFFGSRTWEKSSPSFHQASFVLGHGLGLGLELELGLTLCEPEFLAWPFEPELLSLVKILFFQFKVVTFAPSFYLAWEIFFICRRIPGVKKFYFSAKKILLQIKFHRKRKIFDKSLGYDVIICCDVILWHRFLLLFCVAEIRHWAVTLRCFALLWCNAVIWCFSMTMCCDAVLFRSAMMSNCDTVIWCYDPVMLSHDIVLRCWVEK